MQFYANFNLSTPTHTHTHTASQSASHQPLDPPSLPLPLSRDLLMESQSGTFLCVSRYIPAILHDDRDLCLEPKTRPTKLDLPATRPLAGLIPSPTLTSLSRQPPFLSNIKPSGAAPVRPRKALSRTVTPTWRCPCPAGRVMPEWRLLVALIVLRRAGNEGYDGRAQWTAGDNWAMQAR
ncbi:hypothetical protein E2C01_023143 [Portunus trituberculatus]|uniref:Uncharacterized protein n=1 Tax=Portunus trituberculatus TaxID=210409 RepID=A0A5B7E790_PORTR|nr:hypothetical protein [Portunus trituberculatus]